MWTGISAQPPSGLFDLISLTCLRYFTFYNLSKQRTSRLSRHPGLTSNKTSSSLSVLTGTTWPQPGLKRRPLPAQYAWTPWRIRPRCPVDIHTAWSVYRATGTRDTARVSTAALSVGRFSALVPRWPGALCWWRPWRNWEPTASSTALPQLSPLPHLRCLSTWRSYQIQCCVKAACTLSFPLWSLDPALTTTVPWTCFAMKTRSVCVRCVVSMDTRDTTCSNHRKRGGRDRCVMDKADITRVMSSVVPSSFSLMLVLVFKMKYRAVSSQV